MKKQNKKIIQASEFDQQFDQGKDMSDFLDTQNTKVNKNIQRVNIDFPVPFLRKLDQEAQKVGVARTALIKMWLAEHLKCVH